MYRRRRILPLLEKPENDSHRPYGRSHKNASDSRPRRLVSVGDDGIRHRSYFRYYLALMLIQAAAIALLNSLNESAVTRKLREKDGGRDADSLQVNDASGSGEELQDLVLRARHDALGQVYHSHERLDNYYSRTHMVEYRDQNSKPVLIVGGSDGSGTRAVVDLLGRLGVPMLVDDTGTYDVDASCLSNGKGWPPLVQKILGSTHSANYELEDLSSLLLNQAIDEFEVFYSTYQDRAQRLLLNIEQSNRTVVSKVNYGFKAPVSMLLLPILKEVYGRVKFLHVIRDGRDVSVSDNQSPVQKFYDSFYSDASTRRQLYDKPEDVELGFLMAMQLWNDWNIQVHEWAMDHNDGTTFDYLMVRSEDLLDPLLRHKTLLQLAHFVGSPRTPKDVCCIGSIQMTDMGQSNGKTRRRGTDARAIIPFADIDTLSDQGSGSGLYDSNLEALHLSWKESIDSNTTAELESYQFKASQAMNEQKRENALPLALKKAHEILLQRLSAESHAFGGSGRGKIVSAVESSTQQTGVSDVKGRYGKWVERLKDRPDVIALMQAEGAAALELFGYQPLTHFLDEDTSLAGMPFLCDPTAECDV